MHALTISQCFSHHSVLSFIAPDPAGAADEEMFIKSFEDVPVVHFSSTKELDEELSKIKEWLSEANNSDWQKRVNAMKRLRGLMRTGAHEHKEFTDFLRFGELSFISCVKDLRSQVVRESCLTIAYISLKLGVKSGRFCESLLQILINLIPNSAKIMSSSATVAIRFIIAYTRLSRLIPIITYNVTSKSREIRKACCEFLDQMLHTWSTGTLEKHAASLQDAIKKGISDADPEARQFARKAFWGFADHFRERADQLLQSLDPSKQRILHGEQFSSQSSASSGANHRLLNYHTAGISQLDGPSSLSSSPRLSSSSTPSQSRNPQFSNNITNSRRVNQPVSSTSNKTLGARSSSSLSNGSSSVRSNIPKYGTSTTPKQNNGELHAIVMFFYFAFTTFRIVEYDLKLRTEFIFLYHLITLDNHKKVLSSLKMAFLFCHAFFFSFCSFILLNFSSLIHLHSSFYRVLKIHSQYNSSKIN